MVQLAIFVLMFVASVAEGQFTYEWPVTAGRCGSVPGRLEIDTQMWCQEAAITEDIKPTYTQDPYPQLMIGTSYVPGCHTNINSHLYFNPHKLTLPHLVIPSKVLCSNDNRCLCARLPLCSVTDGSVGNGATACSCGATICTATTGMFCDSIHSQCSSSAISACPWPNGTSPNSVTCVCGSTTCNLNTGLFCRRAQISRMANHGDWYETQISFMHPELLTGSEGSCSKTPIFYSFVNNGETCLSESGRYGISDKGVCEEAVAQFAVALYYNPPAPVRATSGSPPGCNAPAGGVFFNSLSTSSTPCNSDTNRCLCASGQACSQTDGITPNSDECMCNAAVCTTATTGLYCDNTTSTCSRGDACTNTNGSLPNSGACPCGTSYCYSVTGLYCLSDLNLGCRKACSFGKYRSNATNGVCTNCPVGQHSDDASDMTRCKLW
jgi:hypothetical protein